MNELRQHCDFSCSEKLCVNLDNAGVPRDDKWRSLAIYMRGLSYHKFLTTQQKVQTQSLLVNVLKEKDYSDENFDNIMKKNHDIFSAPYAKKIKDAVDESHKLLTDFQSSMKCRKTDIEHIETQTESAISEGKEPQEIISDLRMAFKSLVTTMNQDAARLDSLCRTDALTDLQNRRSFDQFLENSTKDYVNNGTNLSLIMFDIDHFKKFNDTYGHRVGDQALIVVSKIIKKCQKDFFERCGGDVFAARYGGEEFVFIMPGFSVDKACKFAEYVRTSIADYDFMIRSNRDDTVKKRVSITASFGVSELPSAALQGTKGEALIESADQALYSAKANGRNNVCSYFEERKCA